MKIIKLKDIPKGNYVSCSCGGSDRKPSKSEYKLFRHFMDNPDTWWYGYQLKVELDLPEATLFRGLGKLYKKGILHRKIVEVSNRTRKSYCLDGSHIKCLQVRIDNYEIE